MSNHGSAQDEPEERPGWLYPLIIFAITAVIGAGILLFYIGPGVDDLTGATVRPTSEASAVAVSLGERRFVIPSNYIRLPAARGGGAMERIELEAILPDMRGFSEADVETMKDVSQSSPLVSIILTNGGPALSEGERFERIYRRNADPDSEPTQQDGFEVASLTANSGYAGQHVLTRLVDGRQVVLLCTANDLDYEIGGLCQREFGWGEGLTLSYAFRKSHLADWEGLDAKVRQLVTRLEPAAKN
jgi:hypothetical protein